MKTIPCAVCGDTNVWADDGTQVNLCRCAGGSSPISMTLEDAFKVAKAVGDCIDPPVIHGIFKSLNEAFPQFWFELADSGRFIVRENDGTAYTSRFMQGSIYE